MGVYAGIISGIIGTGVKLLGSSGGPQYPSPPKLYKLNIPKATSIMEGNEQNRMDASVNAWKTQFPDLYKGEQAEINQITDQQKGNLGGQVASDLSSSGLETPRQGDQYALSRDLGMNPLTLSQRTSQAVTRQIAANPEWTKTITGGTLATMLANNYQNQTAYGMMMNSNRTAQSIAGSSANLYNTQALLGGLTGAARVGAQVYNNNQYSPLSPVGQGAFQSNPNSTMPYTTYPSSGWAGAPGGSPYQANAGGSATVGPVTPYNSGSDYSWLYQNTPNNYVQQSPYDNYNPFGT